MNLMFWKKKTGAGEEAAQEDVVRNSRGSLDFSAGEAETPVPDEAEAPPEPAAQKGSWLDGLLRRFRKAPAFRAESLPGGEASEAEDEASSGMEAPARPGWPARIKLQLAAALQGLRKTRAPAADEEESGESGGTREAGEPDESAAPAKAGVLARLGAALAAFTRELRAPASPAAAEEGDGEEKAGARSRSEAESFEEAAAEAPEVAKPVRSRKWLVIGGSVVIVALLLADIAVTLWLAYEPPQKRWGTRHDTTSISSRHPESDSAPGEPQSEVDALMRENAALQARIEALKKQTPAQQVPAAPPRQAYVPPAPQGGGSAAAPTAEEGLTLGASDPKAAAMTLKEAIETMNAASGERPRKPGR